MRLAGINSIEQANAFSDGFIDKYNYRFAVSPKCEANAHRLLQHDDEALAHILSLHTTRTLSKNLECSINNVTYQIQTQTHKRRLQHAKVLVAEDQAGQISIWHRGKPLEYKCFTKREKARVVEDSKTINHRVDKLKRQRQKPTVPSEDHPWRKFAITPKKVANKSDAHSNL